MENLHDNPKWVSVALGEVIDVVYSEADDDDLCRAIRHAKGSLKVSRDEEVDNKLSDTTKKFAVLQTKVWEAWLELIEFQKDHCYEYPDSGSDEECNKEKDDVQK